MLVSKFTVIIYILQQFVSFHYIMQISNHKATSEKNPKVQRVPISLSAKEKESLRSLARAEIRSESSMARIIYLLGLKQYSKKK